ALACMACDLPSKVRPQATPSATKTRMQSLMASNGRLPPIATGVAKQRIDAVKSCSFYEGIRSDKYVDGRQHQRW
ncbi:MAG: hypothetical protein KDE06_00105, partial [Rhodobacteraceae bacterium]|nr:hypothetical protein [Paracoccaceae bacterium]